MHRTHRILLAIAIVLSDGVIVVVPVTAFFVAYVLIARPLFFQEWVSRVYRK